MKYLKQFLIILAISFIGEVLHELLPLAGSCKHLRHSDTVYPVKNQVRPPVFRQRHRPFPGGNYASRRRWGSWIPGGS